MERNPIIQTARKQILQLLLEGYYTSRKISNLIGIREKDVLEALPHIQKSLGKGQNIISHPARCLDCGFMFRKRVRVTTPGRCPVCRSEAISPPFFGIDAPASNRQRYKDSDQFDRPVGDGIG
jgi:predicted Zn-ribbon and HTH transcriptional regulator